MQGRGDSGGQGRGWKSEGGLGLEDGEDGEDGEHNWRCQSEVHVV